ncbi:fimbrial protein, partial [Pantoea endophytica]
MKLKASVALLALAGLWSVNASADGVITVTGQITNTQCTPVITVDDPNDQVSGQDVALNYGKIPATDLTDGKFKEKFVNFTYSGCTGINTASLSFIGSASQSDQAAFQLAGNNDIGLYLNAIGDGGDQAITPDAGATDPIDFVNGGAALTVAFSIKAFEGVTPTDTDFSSSIQWT